MMATKLIQNGPLAKTASLIYLMELAFGVVNDSTYAGDGTFFKHFNEVAIVLDGATSATVTVEPAGLVFNDIMEQSLIVSNQFPWQPAIPPNIPDEMTFLGTSLAGGSTVLTDVENKGVGFESPWPGDNYYFFSDPPIEVTEVMGMLGYGRYKITIDELVFYLNTIDGRWNWAYFNRHLQ